MDVYLKGIDPAWGSFVYTVGVLESNLGGSTLWILQRVWVTEKQKTRNCAGRSL